MMTNGSEFYGATATPGMYGAGSAWGYGYGNARFGFGAAGCTSPWFVGFGGLVMSRDNENNYLFSYDSADESIQLTNARNANFDWAGWLLKRASGACSTVVKTPSKPCTGGCSQATG